MLVIGVHQLGNCCHPIKHGNEMAVRFPKVCYEYFKILKMKSKRKYPKCFLSDTMILSEPNSICLEKFKSFRDRKIKKRVTNASYDILENMYLNTSMGTKVKIEFCWMANSNINSCTSRNISTSSNFIITISTEKSKI